MTETHKIQDYIGSDDTIPTPLSELIRLQADKLILKENLQADLNDLDKTVKALIAKHLPNYDLIKGDIEQAGLDYASASNAVRMRALEVEPASLKQYGGAIGLVTKDVVIHFDEDAAIKFARRNPQIATQAGLVQYKVRKSDWQKAIKNGIEFPAEIITVEKHISVRITESKLRNFSTTIANDQ